MVLIAIRQGFGLYGLLAFKALFALVNLLCNKKLSLFRKEGVRHRPGGRFPAVRQGFGLNDLWGIIRTANNNYFIHLQFLPLSVHLKFLQVLQSCSFIA